jgi:hypothetical protein
MLLVQIYLAAQSAGYQATNAYYSNFLGFQADKCCKCNNSNFFGTQVGSVQQVPNQSNSRFNKLVMEQQML